MSSTSSRLLPEVVETLPVFKAVPALPDELLPLVRRLGTLGELVMAPRRPEGPPRGGTEVTPIKKGSDPPKGLSKDEMDSTRTTGRTGRALGGGGAGGGVGRPPLPAMGDEEEEEGEMRRKEGESQAPSFDESIICWLSSEPLSL